MSSTYPTPTILPEAYTNSNFQVPQSIIDKEYKTLFVAEGQSLPYINTAVRGDLYFHLHLSGVVIVGLAPHHTILKENLEVINFKWKKVGDGPIQLAGKRKVGAAHFSPDDTVVVIECKGGEEFHVKPYIRGRLAEMNSSFQQQPVPIDPNIALMAAYHNNKNKNKGGNRGKNNQRGQQKNKNNDNATDAPMTVQPAPEPAPPAPLPIPPQVYEPELLESYKLLHQDPARRGYLCMFLLNPEQMQLMIRLFLSRHDYNELCRQRAQFELTKIEKKIDFNELFIPRVQKALSLTKPTFIINSNGGRPMLSFKKGELRVNGVYKNVYEGLEFEKRLFPITATNIETSPDPQVESGNNTCDEQTKPLSDGIVTMGDGVDENND